MDDRIGQRARSFIELLWKDIEQRILYLLHPHHVAHEAGGIDQVKIRVEFLKNVKITDASAADPDNTPADWAKAGEVLTYVEGPDGNHDRDFWTNRSSGLHEAHFSLPLPYAVLPPGPKNLSGTDMKIWAFNAISDGDVSGTANGIPFSLSNSEVDYVYTDPLIWPNGERLHVDEGLVDGGTGNWLALTWSVSF